MFEAEIFVLGTCSEDEDFSLEHGSGGCVLWMGGAFRWGVCDLWVCVGGFGYPCRGVMATPL